MYDLNKQSKPSLCSFSIHSLCTYIPQTHTLQSLQAKPHHYPSQTQISELIQNLSQELFEYSSSMQKAHSKEEKFLVQNIFLENVKKILVFSLDKHGLIVEQKLFYLVVSLLHTKHNGLNNLRQLLNETHYLLTCSLWSNPKQPLPFSLILLLNSQYEELIDYVRQQLSNQTQNHLIQSLIDILVSKIEETQTISINNNNTSSFMSKPYLHKLISQINQSDWVKKLLSEMKKKDHNAFELFQGEHEAEILLAVLSGNQSVIQELSKGSWGLYLNLYINFIQKLIPQPANKHPLTKSSYQTVIRSYLQKYFSTNKPSKKSTQQQQQIFLIKLINTFSPQNRFSFHQIYQSSFSIFSPVISHFIGVLLLQCNMADQYSIANNEDYHEDILLGLIDNCNKVGWTALVYVIGFVQNNTAWFKDTQGKESMWENLMFHYLPYEIDTTNSNSNLQNQIKQIEQKLQDLNLIGLSNLTKTYLNTLFNLQLNQKNATLTESILQIFFLTLEMSDSSNANHCFHQMKIFISQYYRTKHFNYELLNCLENIFQRKQAILSEKMEQKIQKLFCLIYKIQMIYGLAEGETQDEEEQKSIVLSQISEFNKMFIFSSSKKQKSVSLCVELLRLAAYLHSRVQNILNLGAELIPEMTPQHQQLQKTKSQSELQIVKQFQWNVHNYLNEWKGLNKGENTSQELSEQAIEELIYFDKYFY